MTKFRQNRRQFLGTTAATLAAAGLYAPAGPRAVADGAGGIRHAPDRPARRLCRGRRVHHHRRPRGGLGRASSRAARTSFDRGHRQGQPVEPEPRRRRGARADRRRRDRHHACGQHARDDEPGGDDLRDRGDPLHLQSSRRGSRGSSGVKATRPIRQAGRPSTTPTTSSGGSRTSSRSSPTCGTSSTRTARRRSLSQRCRWQCLGRSECRLPAAPGRDELQPHRPGPVREPAGRFLGADLGLQAAECEIITGVVLPPDFATFWTQAAQQGFRPKAASIGKAILFPSAVNAIGPSAQNLSSEVWWSNVHPFSSSITGASAGEVCDGFEQATGRQWTQPLGFVHALFEVLVDVLKRESEIRDPEAVAAAIAATDARHHRRPDPLGRRGPAALRAAERHQDPARRRSVAEGRMTVCSSLVIVDNQTYPDIPLTGDMEAIG
jgi:hypothetical protein